MKHSKGPWQVFPPYMEGDAYSIGSDGTDDIGTIRSEADAELAAAAPDLLEALIQAERRIQSLNGPNDTVAIEARKIIARLGGSK